MASQSRHTTRRTSKKIWTVRVGLPHRRMTVLLVAVGVFALILGLRCTYVQGLDPSGNAEKAMLPQTQTIPATRGTITDRNGQIMADSESAVNITADPTIVATNGLVEDTMSLADQLKAQAGPGIIAGVLSAYLGGDFQTYYNKLSTTATSSGTAIKYTILQQGVLTYNNLQVTNALNNLGYVGLYRDQAPIREYPNGTVGANVLGFMTYSDDLDSQGVYPWTGGEGLEYALNSSLSGTDGKEVYEMSPYGKIPTTTSVVEQPQEGISYQLTIDLGLQYMQDQRLAQAVQQSQARSGMAITMDVKTGQVLAMSDYPTFDPNNPGGSSSEVLGNDAVRDAYEPGSVEKLLTMSALVDQGLVTPDTKAIVPGRILSGDSYINDSWSHDTIHLTAAGIIAHSSNVGIDVLARQMSKQSLVSYLQQFGLGQPTGIGLPGEASGYVPDASMSDQTRDNIAFGQGLSVTAIQEAAAVAAIANGGVYNSPSIIKSATNSDGTPVALPAPSSHRVISQSTATAVLSMMEGVPALNGGFVVPGYNVAAKSGTAQAIDPSCGCYNGYVMSYIGVAPAENPSLLTYVVLDHPAGGSGTSVAAPVVQDVMKVALARYAVPTSTVPPANDPLQW